MKRAWVTALAVLLALAPLGVAWSATLGPLLFTPQQRRAIELARQRGTSVTPTAVTVAPYVPRWVTVRGISRRQRGQDVVWLDDIAVADGDRWERYRVRIVGSRVQLTDATGQRLLLQVGARFEPRLRRIETPLSTQVRRQP